MSFYRYMYRCLFCVFLVSVESATVVALTAGCVLVGLDGCEVLLCDPCARLRPCAPWVSRVCPGSGLPRCLFTGGEFCERRKGVAVL